MIKTIQLEQRFKITLPKPPVQPGVIWLKGSNGIGKTTLLRFLSFKYPTNPIQVFNFPNNELKEKASFYFEDTMISHDESLQKNLNFINKVVDMDVSFQTLLLAKFHLKEDILIRKFKKCSTGEKTKFISILNLSQKNKSIYFLDEPFENIDTASKENMIQVLHEMFSSKKTLYISSHQPNEVKKLNPFCLDFDKTLSVH